MDYNRLAIMTPSLASVPSRRDILRGLAGAGLGLGVARLPAVVAAKRQRKKKVKRNAFGCVDVGDLCTRADQCCSGICQGKKGKKRCRAHDTGTCQTGGTSESCDATGGGDVPCTTSLGFPGGFCETTTGGASFCAISGDCFGCTTDADCQKFCGPRAACIVCPDCAGDIATSCVNPEDDTSCEIDGD